MLNNQDLINRLTIEQKLSLLADVSSWKRNWGGGAVRFSVATTDKVNGMGEQGSFPSFSALINCWNPDLIGQVSSALVDRAKQQGVTLMQIPAAKPKLTPYADGMSEDPYWMGKVASLAVEEGRKKGLYMMQNSPLLTEDDYAYSDETIDARTVREFFRAPFEEAKRKGLYAVKLPADEGSERIAKGNADWREKLESGMRVVYNCKTAEERLAGLTEGKDLCESKSYAQLKEAHDRYLQLKDAALVNSVYLSQIEAGVATGEVLTTETVDKAVDGVLDFIKSCQDFAAKPSKVTDTSELQRKAAIESVVLLKNDGILPLNSTTKVGLFGDLARVSGRKGVESICECAERMKESGALGYCGFARGYDIGKDRSDELLDEAVLLAKKVDVAVVVVGYDKKLRIRLKKNKTAKLPANQTLLVEKLTKAGVKVVTVVAGGYPDMKFDEACKASLIAWQDGTYSAQALLRILTGEESPSGKLAVTCYADTDEYFETLRRYKEAGRNKVGGFYGYRYYDTADIPVKYPFGHGLTYSRVVYSRYKQFVDSVSFTVKNVGKVACDEVVQVYVGMEGSAYLRAKKQLMHVEKVHLRAGEQKTIILNKHMLALPTWDSIGGTFITEYGCYQLYVGASCTDVCLQGEFIAGDEEVPDVFEKNYSDYLQTHSNVCEEEYTLEPPVEGKKATFHGKFALVWLILMACADLVYGYLHLYGWLPKEIYVYVIVGVLNGLPLLLLTILTIKYIAARRKERVNTIKEKKRLRAEYDVEDLAEEIPYEALFEEEFEARPVVQLEEKAEEAVRKTDEEIDLLSLPFDKGYTLAMAVSDLRSAASGLGLVVDEESARRLLASFAASRLVIVRTEDKSLLSHLYLALGKFFGTKPCLFGAPAHATPTFEKDQKVDSTARKIAFQNKVRLYVYASITAENATKQLSALSRYIDQPTLSVDLSVAETGKESRTPLTQEGWIILSLADGEKETDVPKYLLDMASVADISLRLDSQRQAAEELQKKEAALGNDVAAVAHTTGADTKTIDYAQLEKSVAKAQEDYPLKEVLWKRVDKLEETVAQRKDYRIENKQWQRMEKYASAYVAMEGTQEDALDLVVAGQLISGIVATLKDAPATEEKLTQVLESIFGEGNASASVKAVKSTGINV
ncbi:MAG: glycoside hydrolase family 3 C-terminal domain-containing protein [Clostridia bacterium]|nr:glycoside hydrolase family 3 C-terminal domain-containing protein [Clostridia bacterium]